MDRDTSRDTTLPRWIIPVLLGAILSIGVAIFGESYSRGLYNERDNLERHRVFEQRLDAIEAEAKALNRARAETEREIAAIRGRQNRVIAELAKLDPKTAETLLRDDH